MTEMGTWQAETSRIGWSMGLTWIKHLKQRNLEKIFKYIQNHKYYEQHYHYVSFTFQQTSVCTQPHTGLSSKSLLFILSVFRYLVETTQLLCWSTWSQVYNWSLLWTVLSFPKSSTAYSLCQTQTKSPKAAFFKLCLWFLNGGFGTL